MPQWNVCRRGMRRANEYPDQYADSNTDADEHGDANQHRNANTDRHANRHGHADLPAA
jgi:hypothetical protein